MSYENAQLEGQQVPAHAWILWLVVGVLSTVIGVWLIFSPRAAIGTLALLLAIALFMNGIGELVSAGDRFRPWFGYLLAAVFLIAGFVVLLRPGKSLWFLAVVVGISIIVTGLAQILLAVIDREAIKHWLLLALLGAIGVVVGVLAIAWPDITVYVLALLIGIRLLVFGLIQIAIAFQVRSLSA